MFEHKNLLTSHRLKQSNGNLARALFSLVRKRAIKDGWHGKFSLSFREGKENKNGRIDFRYCTDLAYTHQSEIYSSENPTPQKMKRFKRKITMTDWLPHNSDSIIPGQLFVFIISKVEVDLTPIFSSLLLTGTRSGYFFLIFSPSALLFSNGCSSLYCHFIVIVVNVEIWLLRLCLFPTWQDGDFADVNTKPTAQRQIGQI